MKKNLILKLANLCVGAFLLINSAHATSSGNVSPLPATATKLVNEVFTVTIKVTNPNNFKGFQADVALHNLTITGFSNLASGVVWGNQPSESSLNFAGAFPAVNGTPSPGSTTLNVYTLSVKGTSAGSPTIVISNAKVVEVGSSTYTNLTGGTFTYTINSPTPTPTTSPTSTPGPTSTAVPTVAPTYTNVPGAAHTPTPTRTPSPTHTPTPTPIPNCTPVCTGKTCGNDGCNGSCGSCLSGYACSTAFACIQDPNLTEDLFQTQWDGIENIGDVSLQLGFNPLTAVIGPDGNSIGNFRFFGTTAPNVDLNIYIFSTPLIKSTKSDALGNWSVTISEPLAAGAHHAYAVIVTNGVETKNSEIVAFDINPATKVVALTDSIKVTPTPTLTTAPVTTSTSSIMPLAFLILAFVIILGFLFVYKRRKKQTHVKKEMVKKPIASLGETEE